VPVEVERRDAVAVVTLADPQRRNALGDEMVAGIVDAFEALEADDTVGAAVVTGAPPAFCSGAVLSNLDRLSSDAGAEERGSIRDVYEGFLRIRRSPLPTIAAVNGPAVGAGMNVALACDIRLAGASARFDARFPRIGLHPGGGHTWLLERLVGPQTAAAMLLFGESLDAAAAVERGLAWRAVGDADLLDAAVALGARAAEVPRPLAARVKATLQAVAWQASFDGAVDGEVEDQTWSFAQGWFAERTRP
jgi:enoyl-CoA hydratase